MSWPPHHRQTVPDVELDGPPREVAAEGAAQPVLVVLNGAQIGERLRLEHSAIEIGRDPAAALVLRDAGVGWRHARLEPSGDGWAVIALEGAPPTVEVNGMRVSRLLLSADDRVQIGSVVVRFELHGPIEQAFDAAVEERLSRDDLTGLLSRRKFELELSARIDAAVLGAGTIGLAVIDLDRLKEINDRHGHLVGARMIAAAGRAIAEVLEEPAFACRLGGDEFAIAVPGGDVAATTRLAEAVVAAITSTRVAHGGESLGVGASGGISVGPAQGSEAFTLLRAADDALLRAKRDGRGVVRG